MSQTKYVDESVTKFLSLVGRGDAVPGCGSVAALAGAAAAALTATSARVAMRTDKTAKDPTLFAKLREEAPSLLSESQHFWEELAALIQKDAFLFAEYRTKQETANESSPEVKAQLVKEARESLKRAAFAPLEIADLCLSVAELALKYAWEGPSWAAGDAHTAGYLALAAVESSAAIGATNVQSESRHQDPDIGFCTDLVRRVSEQVDKAASIKQKFPRFQDHKHVRRFIGPVSEGGECVISPS